MQTVIANEEEEEQTGQGFVSENGACGALNGVRKSGKITLFVRTRRVCVSSHLVSIPSFESGLAPHLGVRSKRVTISKDVLDAEQQEALENSAALAATLGVRLEVKDLSKLSLLDRLLALFPGRKLAPETPSISFAGEAITLLSR